jgi:hypothetical protein
MSFLWPNYVEAWAVTQTKYATPGNNGKRSSMASTAEEGAMDSLMDS